jgi:hypothetical protein
MSDEGSGINQMKRLWRSANISIGRATAFAAFAIACVMIPLSFNPRLMMRAGGLLTLGLAVGLILKANLAVRQDYRRTEMWLLLPPDDRPPREVAKRVSGTVLRETYLRFAMFAAGASAIMWTMKVLLRLGAYVA